MLIARSSHTSVVLLDGSVLLMGGSGTIGSMKDVWKTVDGGASWILVTSSAGWAGKGIKPTDRLSSLWVHHLRFVC